MNIFESWSCRFCTFINTQNSREECEICMNSRADTNLSEKNKEASMKVDKIIPSDKIYSNEKFKSSKTIVMGDNKSNLFTHEKFLDFKSLLKDMVSKNFTQKPTLNLNTWTCALCEFANNSMERKICQICSTIRDQYSDTTLVHKNAPRAANGINSLNANTSLKTSNLIIEKDSSKFQYLKNFKQVYALK